MASGLWARSTRRRRPPIRAPDISRYQKLIAGPASDIAVLANAALGCAQPPAAQDHRFLTARLAAGRREVWEGNVGAHTLALLALHSS
ncbi:hypothetical protein [Streptosporangium sp. NPDC003464]